LKFAASLSQLFYASPRLARPLASCSRCLWHWNLAKPSYFTIWRFSQVRRLPTVNRQKIERLKSWRMEKHLNSSVLKFFNSLLVWVADNEVVAACLSHDCLARDIIK
jgi:hypothetical protein